MRLLRILRCSRNGVAVDTCLLLNNLSTVPACLLYKRLELFQVPDTLFLMRKSEAFPPFPYRMTGTPAVSRRVQRFYRHAQS